MRGLPAGNVDDLFRPFEQRGADRTGVGLGPVLSLGRRSNDGRIYARNLPIGGSCSLPSTCRGSDLWRRVPAD